MGNPTDNDSFFLFFCFSCVDNGVRTVRIVVVFRSSRDVDGELRSGREPEWKRG